MVKLAGNHPTDIAAKPSGAIAPARMLTMSVTLRVRNPEELQRLISEQQDPSSPNYHRWLTPREFNSRFGPDPAQFNAVRDWLVEQGFQVVESSLQRRSITFTGDAALAQRVFETKIRAYAGDSYANIDDPSIPARFAEVIAAISGLDNVARAIPLSSGVRLRPAR